MPDDEEQEPRSAEPASFFARSEALARRIIVTVVGGTLLLLGVALLVVPGPGLLTLSIGLGVLALEFAWARRWLRRLEQQVARAFPPFGSEEPPR